jgi:hypothetical protein
VSPSRPFAVVAGLIAAAIAFAPGAAFAQCAMCQTALMNSPEARGMGAEFNRAILVMLFAPYAVFGSIGAVLLRRRIAAAVRRALTRVRVPRLVHPTLRAD